MGISATTLGLVSGIASAGVGALGAISNANAQAANASYQAQVAKNNATIASQNAEYATQAGSEKATEASLKARERLGAVTTALAASGVDVNTGSAADVEKTQRETGSLETQQVVNNAALQAYGYRSQSTGYQAEAGLESAEAAEAPTAGLLSATGGLLGSASSLGLNYQILQNLAGNTAPTTPILTGL